MSDAEQAIPGQPTAGFASLSTSTRNQEERPAEGKPARPGPAPVPVHWSKSYIAPGMAESQ